MSDPKFLLPQIDIELIVVMIYNHRKKRLEAETKMN